jgi:DNA-binding LytR/AlgR family response regulator
MMIFKKLDLLTINHKLRLVVDINQIIMLKGNVNYTCFYMQNGKQKTSARPLKFYENQLAVYGFIRVHRAFIINPNFVIEHHEATSQLLLLEGHYADISRRRKNNLSNSQFSHPNL